MPVYVYGGCGHKQEIRHGVHEQTIVFCPQCHELMSRIPQTFRFYHNPQSVLLDQLDDKYRKWRSRNATKKTKAYQ